MIYLAGDSVRGVCKIGWTSDFEKRLNILNQGYPFNFDFILTKFGGIEDECEIMKLLSDKKIKGEWFKFDNNTISVFTEYSPSSSEDLLFCVEFLEKIPGFLLGIHLADCPLPPFKVKAIRRKSGINYTMEDVEILAAYLKADGE